MPPMLLAVIGVFVCFVLWLSVYYLVIYPYYLSPLRHIPGPSSLSKDSLITGQFSAIIKGEAGIPQREWVKKYGSVVRVVGPLGLERVIFTKPEALSKILVSGWTEYPRPKFMRDVLGVVAGFGLLTVTGTEHKQMRKAMNPAFSIPNLMAQTDMYYNAIENLVDILNEELKDGPVEKTMTIYDLMSKVTLDIICTTAFGYNTNSLRNPHNELAEAYETLINLQTGYNLARFIAIVSIPGAARFIGSRFAYEWRHWIGKLPHLSVAAILIDCMYRIKEISQRILDEKLKDSTLPLEDMQSKRDIMSLLVRARKVEADTEAEKARKGEQMPGSGSYRMTDQMMMDQVLTFLGAGHETTASGLAWTLYLLAANPECQMKLRQEIGPFFKGTGETARPDYRTLKDLQLLDCVIMESLRLFPPVPSTFRQAAKTDYIGGHLIPKGTFFYIPIRVVNTWKEIWGDDAEEFRPSRWLNLPPQYTTFSFMSFIAGPHGCIGKTMSILEMKTVIGALVANFEFLLAYEDQTTQPTAAITMKPKDGMPLRIRRV